ncbi:hypothetical protein BD310DRAFT_457409 [Dichomitus squalens]|uniref:F-box domain-containing protein n=1 Tax=Dichomitus squalens TaxID=114155 RepID=A0A4Q9PW33_9APHY|nr:hypothetical protein BD310DRAFT_457409 [Dichomitus squalens]
MQHGPLSRLPFELLEMIFQYLEDIPWIALFAITCKSLLALSKPHLLRAFRNTYAFCANCRMILLQEYEVGSVFPSMLLTGAEEKEIAETTTPSYPGDLPRCLYSFAVAFYQPIPDIKDARRRKADAFWYHFSHLINVAQCWALVEDAELPPDKQKRRARDWTIPIYDTWYQDAMRYPESQASRFEGSPIQYCKARVRPWRRTGIWTGIIQAVVSRGRAPLPHPLGW